MQIIGDIRDRDWQKAGLVMLSMLLIAVLAFAVAQTRALNAANARIDAMVQKAFYETCELTEGMAVNFRKLLVAGERGQMQALLNETALQTQGAMSDLALLPLGQETVSATLKFINQAGDFARALSVKLGNGGTLTEQDHETLRTLSETAAGFSVSLARLLDRYEKGEAVFDGASEAAGQENLAPITSPAGEYPVLLYDGPFSDGRSDGDFKTLRGLAEVDEPTARQRLTAFLGQQVQDVQLTGEGSVPVDCYEYSLQMGDYRLSAGVTKAGGEVLYLLCDSDVGDVNITQDAAVRLGRGGREHHPGRRRGRRAGLPAGPGLRVHGDELYEPVRRHTDGELRRRAGRRGALPRPGEGAGVHARRRGDRPGAGGLFDEPRAAGDRNPEDHRGGGAYAHRRRADRRGRAAVRHTRKRRRIPVL